MESMRSTGHLVRGRDAEQLAEQYLLSKGFSIVARNFKCRQGEIDLIATNGQILHFIEVKGRWTDKMGRPLDQINRHKMKRIARAAQMYLYKNSKFMRFRLFFSVLGVDGKDDPPRISWVPNAFDNPLV